MNKNKTPLHIGSIKCCTLLTKISTTVFFIWEDWDSSYIVPQFTVLVNGRGGVWVQDIFLPRLLSFPRQTQSPGSKISPKGETFSLSKAHMSVFWLAPWWTLLPWIHFVCTQFLSSRTATADHLEVGGTISKTTCWETPLNFSSCFCRFSGEHTRRGKGRAAVTVLGSWGAWQRPALPIGTPIQ